ncbi:hypothetical protein J4474_04490 [Candidatus Pacearchaeota archaeon]|nr:hypothetical protein [Candidatus Pacearchaeota archaeon]
MVEKNSWVGIVAVIALILSVVAIAVILSGGMTGNVIKLNNVPTGSYSVYTKAEVDTLLLPLTQIRVPLLNGETKTFPFLGNFHSMSIDYISLDNKLKIQLDGSISPAMRIGQVYTVAGFKLWIEAISGSQGKVTIGMKR